eukprot:UN25419
MSKIIIGFLIFIFVTLIISIFTSNDPSDPDISNENIINPDTDPGMNQIIDSQEKINENEIHQEIEKPKNIKPRVIDPIFHKDYHSTADIYDFYREKARETDVYVDIQILGQTPLGADMIAVQVGESGKLGVWLNCGFHAREWIAPATCLYLYDFLLNSTDPDVLRILDRVTFYFTPLANPDGYEYSRTPSCGDRCREWRKTMEPIGGKTKGLCIGVDLDRNWPYKFDLQVDISTNPCEENYGGLTALSAPENKMIYDYIIKKKI